MCLLNNRSEYTRDGFTPCAKIDQNWRLLLPEADCEDTDGNTVLSYAAANGCVEVVEELVKIENLV